MPYDAVLDYEHILYRVEVKGSSSGTYNLTRGGRSGAQIDRHAKTEPEGSKEAIVILLFALIVITEIVTYYQLIFWI